MEPGCREAATQAPLGRIGPAPFVHCVLVLCLLSLRRPKVDDVFSPPFRHCPVIAGPWNRSLPRSHSWPICFRAGRGCLGILALGSWPSSADISPSFAFRDSLRSVPSCCASPLHGSTARMATELHLIPAAGIPSGSGIHRRGDDTAMRMRTATEKPQRNWCGASPGFASPCGRLTRWFTRARPCCIVACGFLTFEDGAG